jgi:TolB-like protein/Flp pilus assembly protein TadD
MGGGVPTARIQFGKFVLDLCRYELTCAGKPIHLERIPMDLLILLVRENGRLIGRDEIIERLWGKDLHFDTDNSINTAIRKLRHALADTAGMPQYIETVLGKGYRFKGRAVSVPSEIETEPSRIMLAVLPFENLSGDPGQEYLSDGLTEETIMRLGQMSPHRLGVIARTSSMAYKQTDKSVAQIGQELGVDFVLEGSVRREGDRVRITAQLIRVRDQIHLWAENYDRQLPGFLDIHGEIGTAVAAQVKLKLMAEDERQLTRKTTQHAEAYDCYLRGLYHLARYNLFDAQKAIQYFQSATERDPTSALAHSALADALMVFPISGDASSREVFLRAKAAITRALQMDQNSAEAHASDAAAKFWFDWDFKGVEVAARRAVKLNENYTLAYLFLAHVFSNTGRHDEALAIMQQALVLDPLSLILGAIYGQFLYHAGRNSESIEQFKVTLGMEPRFWVGQICAAKVYEKVGMYSEALVACEHAWEFSGGNTEALSLAGYVHAVSGDRAKAEASVDQMLELKKERYVPPYNVALLFAGLGQTEAALQWLEQAFADRDVHMPFLLDHKWDVIRPAPQFQDLLSRVGFPTHRTAFLP